MDGGDDKVEFFQQLVGKIETPVPENVHLAAGQQAKAVEILVETGDLVDLRLEVFLAQPAGLGLASGMVGVARYS